MKQIAEGSGNGRSTASALAIRRPLRPNWRYLMLSTIIVILVVLWLLGMVSSYTLGGFIHVLLVVAVIVLVFRLLSGRRVL